MDGIEFWKRVAENFPKEPSFHDKLRMSMYLSLVAQGSRGELSPRMDFTPAAEALDAIADILAKVPEPFMDAIGDALGNAASTMYSRGEPDDWG